MSCQHQYATFEITITRQIVALTQISEICDYVTVDRDEATGIRIAVHCRECEHTAVYNAYATGPNQTAVNKWPTWLLNRLIPLRGQNVTVQEACRACGVPPVDHPSWR
jgi:hypothetical protein